MMLLACVVITAAAQNGSGFADQLSGHLLPSSDTHIPWTDRLVDSLSRPSWVHLLCLHSLWRWLLLGESLYQCLVLITHFFVSKSFFIVSGQGKAELHLKFKNLVLQSLQQSVQLKSVCVKCVQC